MFFSAVSMISGGICIATEYTYTNMVDNSGFLDSFSAPSLNNQGEVAFFSYTDDSVAGIYKTDGQTLVTIVDDTGEYSFWGGGMSLASMPAVSDNGYVAFFAYTDSFEHGVYKGNGGPITVVAQTGSGYVSIFDNPGVNVAGMLVFYCTPDSNSEAIVAADGTQTITIADDSGSFGWFYESNDINDNGLAAFLAGGGSGADYFDGIFTDDGPGGASLVTVAVLDDGYTSFGTSISMNNDGVVAFTAETVASGSGVFKGDGTFVETVAAENDGFFFFDQPAINNNGVVAFLADNYGYSTGIYTGPDWMSGEDRVIETGQDLFGSVVTSIDFFHFGINDLGQVAFHYVLDDGREGIALATPVSNPVPGDLNGDGCVDQADLGILLGAYGAGAGGDLDGDGDTDQADLGVLLGNYGNGCP